MAATELKVTLVKSPIGAKPKAHLPLGASLDRHTIGMRR